MIETLGLPHRPLKSAGLSKLGRAVLVLLLPLAFDLDASPSRAPLFEGRFHFLVTTLVCDDFVLGEEPELFHFLLLHVICWIVVIVVGPTLEAVLVSKDHRLLIIGKEFTER